MIDRRLNLIDLCLMKTAVVILSLLMSCALSYADEFITGTQARQMISYQGAIVIDVRTTDEYRARHVPGALHFPVESLGMDLHYLGDFNRPIIVYCRSGRRSAAAMKTLIQAGFGEVYNMGPLENWDR